MRPESAADRIVNLDSTNPSHREEVLETVSSLLKDFVLPVTKPYFRTSESTYLNLQEIARVDFSDLLLGALTDEFPVLNLNVPVQQVMRPLEKLGFGITDNEVGIAFFRAWNADRGLRVVRLLFEFLLASTPPIQASKNEFRTLNAIPLEALPLLEAEILKKLVALSPKSPPK